MRLIFWLVIGYIIYKYVILPLRPPTSGNSDGNNSSSNTTPFEGYTDYEEIKDNPDKK